MCAKDLQACLTAQLEGDEDRDLILAIVGSQLNRLAAGRYGAIAKELEVPVAAVLAAEKHLKRLHPIPSAGFGGNTANFYLTPDALVEFRNGAPQVQLCSNFTPYLGISRYFEELYRTSEDPEVIRYLSEKLNAAHALFSNITQRETTLLRCVEEIVRIQSRYFSDPEGLLVPMSLADLSEKLELSASTVSRAVRDKSIQCSRGVVPLRALFSRSVEAEKGPASTDSVKKLLQDLIDGEDQSSPLSDAQLAELLSQRGIGISRRTVAKYREALGYPSTFVRRQESK